MRVETEFVKFDDEDRGNIDYEGGEFPFGIHRADKDHMFFFMLLHTGGTKQHFDAR